MSDIILDERKSSIPILLNALVFEDNVLKKLNAVTTIISAIDEEAANKVRGIEFKNYLESRYLNDVGFMRQLKLYISMTTTPETCQEYYSQDYLTHPEYQFDEEFEEVLLRLNKQINLFVGKLLKEMTRGEGITI